MEVDADLHAFDALTGLGRVTDIASVSRAVMTKMAAARRPEAPADFAVQRAAELALAREETTTPFGNALDVLSRGPEDDAQRALARALSALAMASRHPDGRDEEDQAASEVLWLAAHTPFDATGLIDRALGDSATAMWDAIAEQIRRAARSVSPYLGRGEALIAAAAIASSRATAAAKLAGALATDILDRQLALVLSARAGTDGGDPVGRTRGEMAPPPHGPFAAALLAVTGIALVFHAARLIGRVALAYKRPAEVVLADDGGIRVRWRTELLGRTLRDHDVLVPRASLVRASRDVRYPAVALYAGLLALSLGSYLGMAAFVDGVRASSPSLLLTGVVLVVIGVAVDFAFSSLTPGFRGRCRVLFVPRTGRAVCIGDIDIAAADSLLARLARG